jgi:hypothetical protein
MPWFSVRNSPASICLRAETELEVVTDPLFTGQRQTPGLSLFRRRAALYHRHARDLSLTRPHRPIQQQVALECACCKQIYHPDRALADRVEAALFGAEPYTVCPICEQNVSDKMQTDSYKSRWRQAALPRLDDRAVRVAMLSIYLRRGLTSDEEFDKALKEAQKAYPDKTINQLMSMGDEALRHLEALRRK